MSLTNMKTVLAAVLVAAVVAAAAGQYSVNNFARKDGLTIRKCDYPRFLTGRNTDQLCNGRLFCVDDMRSPNNPWYILQSYSVERTTAFNKNFLAYEQGFGQSLEHDYWLGLSCLHKMVAPGNNELLVRLMDLKGDVGIAVYSSFSVGLPSSKYQLRVTGYDQRRSNMGDSMHQSNGMKFTTFDQDNDRNHNANCAAKYKGGWWYGDCTIKAVNNFLNGYFTTSGNQRKPKGVQWQTWNTTSPVVSTLILFRPQLFDQSSNLPLSATMAQPPQTTTTVLPSWDLGEALYFDDSMDDYSSYLHAYNMSNDRAVNTPPQRTRSSNITGTLY